MPSANERRSGGGLPGNWVLIGNPGCRRIELFGEALAKAGLPPARLIPWLDVLQARVRLPDVVRPGDGVRIESPGRNWEVEHALLQRGAGFPDAGSFARISRAEAGELCPDRGRIFYPRQWYLGFRSVLEQLAGELRDCPPHTGMQDPGETAVMFDKPECHLRLQAAGPAPGGVVVPRALGVPMCYEELRATMQRTRCSRVFVKLAHGSGASGVVAYQTDGTRHQAVTTVESVLGSGETRLYNSRRLRTYREQSEIAELVDALCRHRVHAEQWLPKAGICGHTFDLRVLVIGGRVRHVVPRLSRSPITNLHLLNRRGDPADVRLRMGAEAWDAMRETCHRAAAPFPRSLYVGLDVLIAPDFRRHAILEANAFGDLLPGISCEGRDTYLDELTALSSAGADAAPTRTWMEAPCSTLVS